MTTTHPTLGEARLPRNPLLSEVLALVSKQKTKARRLKLLNSMSLYILNLFWFGTLMNLWSRCFQMVMFRLIKTRRLLEPNIYTLHMNRKKLYNFVKGGNDTLRPMKREQLFMQLLEGLHPDEAEIICLVKDKNLKKKYKLTRAIVEEAFPDIQWGNRQLRMAKNKNKRWGDGGSLLDTEKKKKNLSSRYSTSLIKENCNSDETQR